MKNLIRHILKEETNNVKLVKDIVHDMFDNVKFVEYVPERNEIMVFYTNHDNRQMLIPTEICDKISQYTGLDVIPWYEHREPDNQPDFYIDTEEYEEPTNEKNLRAIKTILPQVSWDGLCDIWVEYCEEDDDYEIRSKSIKRHYLSDDTDIIDELFSLKNILKSMGLMVGVFAPIPVDSCEGETESINEDKETPNEIEKNLRAIITVLSQVSWDGLCDIWVEYSKMDGEYEIRSKYVGESFTIDASKDLDFLENAIRSMGLSVYVYTPWYVDSCEDEVKFINESKENSTKELINKVLNDLVLPQYDHVICGFELHNVNDKDLDNVINYPGVDVTFIGGKGTKLYPQTPGIQKMYDDVLDDIWDTVYDYTGISLELYTKYVKDCGKENIYLR